MNQHLSKRCTFIRAKNGLKAKIGSGKNHYLSRKNNLTYANGQAISRITNSSYFGYPRPELVENIFTTPTTTTRFKSLRVIVCRTPDFRWTRLLAFPGQDVRVRFTAPSLPRACRCGCDSSRQNISVFCIYSSIARSRSQEKLSKSTNFLIFYLSSAFFTFKKFKILTTY